MKTPRKIDRRTFHRLAAFTATGLGALSLSPAGRSASATSAGGKPTDLRVVEASCDTELFRYRSPMKFGGRVMNDIVLLNARIKVENRRGKTAEGFGSMTLGNIWAWPGGVTDPETTLRAMIAFGEKATAAAPGFKEFGHPLEWTHDFAAGYDALAGETVRQFQLKEPMPKLAQRVAASPLEAAVFDAFGKSLDRNVYNLLSEEFCNRDLSHYLGDEFKGEYLDRYTLRTPKPRMPLYHLVGALDPLTPEEVEQPVGDGLPEHLAQWIARDGLTHLKIKLNGDDLDWDVRRVLEVDRVAVEERKKRGGSHWITHDQDREIFSRKTSATNGSGSTRRAEARLRYQPRWVYSVDFNERCPNVDYVLDFFRKIREGSPDAFRRLQYVEQPTHRDLKAHPENKMHRAAEIKPVVIDESLLDFESFRDSRLMGYSGVALKACKGHGDALLMGAAAQKYKMFLCVQDLTCPGASFLQSASLSARIPTVAAIEGNARQYCPAANAPWVEKYPSMFVIKDGTLGTDVLTGSGIY